MSGSKCCFLACIEVSQQTGKVVWYSHLFKNFTQFVLIHSVKDFSIVNEAEVDVFLEFSCFFYDWTDVGSLISAFSKSSLYICKFSVHVLLKPSLENFGHYFASIWDECNWWQFEYFLAFLISGIEMKTDLFQSCGHCWVFQISWHIKCSIFTSKSFRIWNSLTGIVSLPLALFVVMLPKAHLIFQSRISGSRWLITP